MSKNQERNIKDMAERMERRSAVTREEEKRVSGTKNADEAARKANARVASPYGHGVDVVKRVLDTIELMRKSKHLDEQQYQAAQTYKTAFEIVWGQAGGAMDFSRVRGASLPGSPPLPAALSASDLLLEAERLLGLVDRIVVEMVCGEGRSLADVGKMIGTQNPGLRLRESLTVLGRKWHADAEGKEGKMQSWLADGPLSHDAKKEALRSAQEGEIGPVKSVHATAHKVYGRK